jgi:hypothetical protein
MIVIELRWTSSGMRTLIRDCYCANRSNCDFVASAKPHETIEPWRFPAAVLCSLQVQTASMGRHNNVDEEYPTLRREG